MSRPAHDVQRHTYGEYLTWDDDRRWELIDGVAYAMAPAPSRLHQRLVLELGRQIADGLEGTGCEVDIAPFDVRLPKGNQADEQIDTVVRPDLVVVCEPAKLDDRGCRSAPDWVIEVLSPATAAHDQIRKLKLYERHGVPEYWLVHPVDRIVTIYRLEDGQYGRPDIHELTGTLEAGCCDVSIDWERVIAGLPAENGV